MARRLVLRGGEPRVSRLALASSEVDSQSVENSSGSKSESTREVDGAESRSLQQLAPGGSSTWYHPSLL
eukprot:4793786-Prymnesium_polylepis.1